MKKIASLFLALTLCLGLAIPAMAADIETIDGVSITNVVSSETITISIKVLSDDPVTEITGTLYHLEPNATINSGSETGGLISLEPQNGIYVSSDLGGGGQMGESWTVPAPSAEETAAGVINQLITTATEKNIFYVADGAAAADDATASGSADTTPAETPAETPTETTTTVNPFTDVAETSPYRDAILWAVEKGITKGTTDTTFAPSNTCTHNHILTFLWRANGSPAATIENPFDNIDVNGDFGKAALWAAEQKLVDGTSFPGTDACTRSQTVTYLWKLAGSPETAVSDKFTDVAADADYAQAVAWAVAQGITQGTTDTTFSPDATCTRGQIVTFLYRAQQATQTAEAAPEA